MNRVPLPRYLATALLFLAAAFFVSPSAHADTLYTYTGQNFTVVSGNYTTSQRVTGTVLLASPLAANHDVNDDALALQNFSFSDGNQTLDNTNSYARFYYGTDANGALTSYVLYANGNTTALYFSTIQIHDTFGTQGVQGDYARDLIESANNTTAGAFTVTPIAPTPEPSSLLLLGTGILGGAGACIRRLRSASREPQVV